jgi:hypothetical protein
MTARYLCILYTSTQGRSIIESFAIDPFEEELSRGKSLLIFRRIEFRPPLRRQISRNQPGTEGFLNLKSLLSRNQRLQRLRYSWHEGGTDSNDLRN